MYYDFLERYMKTLSVASLSIAAHEAGYAIQDSVGHTTIKMNSAPVPIGTLGTNLGWIFVFWEGEVCGPFGIVHQALLLHLLEPMSEVQIAELDLPEFAFQVVVHL